MFISQHRFEVLWFLVVFFGSIVSQAQSLAENSSQAPGLPQSQFSIKIHSTIAVNSMKAEPFCLNQANGLPKSDFFAFHTEGSGWVANFSASSPPSWRSCVLYWWHQTEWMIVRDIFKGTLWQKSRWTIEPMNTQTIYKYFQAKVLPYCHPFWLSSSHFWAEWSTKWLGDLTDPTFLREYASHQSFEYVLWWLFVVKVNAASYWQWIHQFFQCFYLARSRDKR